PVKSAWLYGRSVSAYLPGRGSTVRQAGLYGRLRPVYGSGHANRVSGSYFMGCLLNLLAALHLYLPGGFTWLHRGRHHQRHRVAVLLQRPELSRRLGGPASECDLPDFRGDPGPAGWAAADTAHHTPGTHGPRSSCTADGRRVGRDQLAWCGV